MSASCVQKNTSVEVFKIVAQPCSCNYNILLYTTVNQVKHFLMQSIKSATVVQYFIFWYLQTDTIALLLHIIFFTCLSFYTVFAKRFSSPALISENC